MRTDLFNIIGCQRTEKGIPFLDSGVCGIGVDLVEVRVLIEIGTAHDAVTGDKIAAVEERFGTGCNEGVVFVFYDNCCLGVICVALRIAVVIGSCWFGDRCQIRAIGNDGLGVFECAVLIGFDGFGCFGAHGCHVCAGMSDISKRRILGSAAAGFVVVVGEDDVAVFSEVLRRNVFSDFFGNVIQLVRIIRAVSGIGSFKLAEFCRHTRSAMRNRGAVNGYGVVGFGL